MGKGKQMLPAMLIALAPVFALGFLFFFELREKEMHEPSILKNGFRAEFEVPCNRFHAMEIGFEIAPPLPVADFANFSKAIAGNATLSFSSHGVTERHDINLLETSTGMNSKGIWIKTLLLKPGKWRLACPETRVSIEARNVNFDMNQHHISIFVSRSLEK